MLIYNFILNNKVKSKQIIYRINKNIITNNCYHNDIQQ